MKRKKASCLLALFCCLALVLTACSNPLDLIQANRIPVNASSGTTTVDGSTGYRSRYGTSNSANARNLMDYNAMEYVRPDVEAMKQSLADTAEQMRQVTDFWDLAELDNSTSDIWLEFNTMYTLAMLGTYQNYDNSFWQEEYEFMLDAAVELDTINNEIYKVILEGPYTEEYRNWAGDYWFEYMQTASLLTSAEVEAYKQEREQLSATYNNDLMNLTVEYNGQQLTMDDVYELATYEDRIAAYTAYYSQNVGHFVEIYARMVELDKLIAATLGFDSAAEMYYLSYTRDYTPSDALALCELVKELFGSIVPYAMDARYTQQVSYDTLVAQMPEFLGTVDTELISAWEDMLTYNLYDHEARENKQSGVAFTTYISRYDAPFTYMYWDDSNSSALTLIHEFGHFYDYWVHYNSSSLNNLDVAEVYSQSLEMLSQKYFDVFFDYPEDAINYSMGDMLQAITYQALLEELQLRAYDLDTITADSVSQIYTELLSEYGYSAYLLTGDDGLDHSWFEVTHMFDYPFYTISYTTSATVALEIWSISQTDWYAAADIYLDMLHADQMQPFTQLVESVGLQNPMERATLEDIAEKYIELFDVPA